MRKAYRSTWGAVLIPVSVASLAIGSLPLVRMSQDLVGTVFFIVAALGCIFMAWIVRILRVLVTHNGFEQTIGPMTKWVHRLSQQETFTPWYHISEVFDDSFLSFHYYKLLGRRRGSSHDGVLGGFSNLYFSRAQNQEILTEIITRVKPGTKVSPSILKRTGLTEADIGRLYKPQSES